MEFASGQPIGGAWRKGGGSGDITTFDPATEGVLAAFMAQLTV